MAALQLTLSCGDYDLTRGLIRGAAPIEGVELTVLPLPSPERHWRMVRHLEFDICELRRISLAWVQPLLEEQRAVMGNDPESTRDAAPAYLG